MNESTSNSPHEGLDHEDHNSNLALGKQHNEDNATTSPANASTALVSATTPRATASITNPTAKHQLAQGPGAEGQQTAWPENNKTSVKRPRLDLADHGAASDLQVPSPTSVMSSSHQDRVDLHPPSQADGTRDARAGSNLPTFSLNQLMMESPYLPRPSQPYQPYSPSPLASGTGGDFDYHDPRAIPDQVHPYYHGGYNLNREGTPIDPRLVYGADVVGKTPDFPAESMPQYPTSQQMPPAVDPETQRHEPQLSTPQSTFDSSTRAQTSDSVPENEVVAQVLPPINGIEKQTRQFSSTKNNKLLLLTLSKPAQGKDLEDFPWDERYLLLAYSKTEQGVNDGYFMQWFEDIRRPFWVQALVSFGSQVPATMYNQVLDELCVSHPCIAFPWVGHTLYRRILGIPKCKEPMKKGIGNLRVLREWMYGEEETTHASWRDALSSKTGEDKKIPWVKREKIIAVSLILDCANAAYRKTKAVAAFRNIQVKREMVEKCKLTYLLSNQDHAVPNEYWDGFVEELEKDPEQTNLYDKVMREEQPTTSGSSSSWSGSPVPVQEAQAQEEQSGQPQGEPGNPQLGSHSDQPSSSEMGSLQTMAKIGESSHQDLGNHEPLSPAQQTLLPAQATGQATQEMTSQDAQNITSHGAPSMAIQNAQNMTGREVWLQDRVHQLEAEAAQLRRYIDSVHQRYPEILNPPPFISFQHQP